MSLNNKMPKKIRRTINVTPNWLMFLGVMFVLLKVMGISEVALWSWWVVLLPFYVWILIAAGIFAIVGVLATAALGIAYVWDSINRYTRRRENKQRQITLNKQKDLK